MDCEQEAHEAQKWLGLGQFIPYSFRAEAARAGRARTRSIGACWMKLTGRTPIDWLLYVTVE